MQLIDENNSDGPEVLSLEEDEEEDDDPKTPVINNQKSSMLKLKNNIIDNLKTEFLDQTYINYDSDDPNKDPDWKKTPLAKRIVNIRKTSTIGKI